MNQQNHPAEVDRPDPRGQTAPVGQDRSHDPAPADSPRPSQGGAAGTPGASEEAKNQAATADKSRAESGTP